MTTTSRPTKTDALRLARQMLAAAHIEIEHTGDRWAAEWKLMDYLMSDVPGSALKAAVEA